MLGAWGAAFPAAERGVSSAVSGGVLAGSYGFVMQALDRDTGQHVALKFIERGAKPLLLLPVLLQITKHVEREVLNHQRLRHPHIIDLKEVFLTDSYLVLVMEYAAGADLFRLVSRAKGLPEGEARWFFQQIMFAVDYSHKMGVANRDIKLENTLLADDSPRPLVKLADFGFSKDENYQSAPGSRVGTPAYLAPEVISIVDGQSYDAKASIAGAQGGGRSQAGRGNPGAAKADVWSCGVLLYVMVTGRYPFRRAEDEGRPLGQRLHCMLQASRGRILSIDYTFPSSLALSEPCRDLIAKMLVSDPLQRLSVQQVLQHPWCSEGLQAEVLSFNESLVASSLANPPSPQVLEEIKSIVREAQQVPESHHYAGAPQAAGGAAAGAGAAAAAATASGGGAGAGGPHGGPRLKGPLATPATAGALVDDLVMEQGSLELDSEEGAA
ncbi:hypothetical protein N2152v2_003925 [Parachlorella kessleri]